ncbi:methyltransferase domain-containing protein [Diaphorobacter nitroreducens]|uniref:methyltransferase domain-containing protein n=1 Tax=Diaphorobacter nitroreducens TaxID=164759 RepID=UPI0028A8ACD6|nr:methyltransferase domain-containing protein [Diaphorobacter nitroreducens]
MKYQASINLANKNNSHTLAFEYINEYAGGERLKVLEVGCSSGYFGAALAEQGHEVWGVEPHSEAAAKAQLVLHKVHIGFVEDFFSKNSDARFDVIVFGDVLEHLVDPVSVLKQSSHFLNENGIVVASIPNIAHFAIRAMLLEGRWDYSDLGILDRTHLRFFTRATIIELFSDAGYKISKLNPVRLSAEQVNELCGMNLKSQNIKLVRENSADERGHDFQYIISASPIFESIDIKSKNAHLQIEGGIRVLSLVPDPNSSIVDIRLRNPLNRWASQYEGSFRLLSLYEANEKDFSWADVIVFQRDASEYVVGLAKYLQKNGKKVIFEIDDLLTSLPPFLSHHQAALEKSMPFIVQMLNISDAITVASDELKIRYEQLNKNVFLVPNYSDPTVKSAVHYDVPPSEVKLIVASSDKVLVDMLIEPLMQLQSEFGVQVVGIGPPGERLASAGLQIENHKNFGHFDFKNFVGSLDNSIGVIPLDNSEFSSCKSAVKYFDYSMAGVPSICSNVLPYANVVENGVTGLLVENNVVDWVEALRRLIDSADLRNLLAARSRDKVMRCHNIDSTAKGWQIMLDALEISKLRDNSSVGKVSIGKRGHLEVFPILFRHLLKPSAYFQALSTARRYGLRGLWERLRVDYFN